MDAFCERVTLSLRDLFSFNCMIDLISKLDADEDAVGQIITEIEASGLQPNTVTFNAVLHYHAVRGNQRGINSTLELMKSREVEMDCITMNSCIDCCAKNGDSRAAIRTFDQMSERIKPCIMTYNIVLNAIAKDESLDDSRQEPSQIA